MIANWDQIVSPASAAGRVGDGEAPTATEGVITKL
jgi:hypothetical protein